MAYRFEELLEAKHSHLRASLQTLLLALPDTQMIDLLLGERLCSDSDAM